MWFGKTDQTQVLSQKRKKAGKQKKGGGGIQEKRKGDSEIHSE